MNDVALVAVLRRDRAIVGACLFALVIAAWAYLLWLAGDMAMEGMDMTGFRMIPAGSGLMMPATAPWHSIEFVFVFLMWAFMMIGMMTPSVAPLILIYAGVGRQAAAQQKPFAASAWLAGGYLLAWISFSMVATVAQWSIEREGWLTPAMASASNTFGGLTLIAAGLYQWTPLKNACLRQCQAPLQFIQRHGGFRGDAIGSLALGIRHGIYCVACCWVLMALLFVGGVMNVLWIAAIMIFVLIEKVVPVGGLISRISGLGFLAAGILMIASPAIRNLEHNVGDLMGYIMTDGPRGLTDESRCCRRRHVRYTSACLLRAKSGQRDRRPVLLKNKPGAHRARFAFMERMSRV
jgi:predicted metal-binding membrane protein